jgi:predicted anti-sigma-YlaC factor YlaD
MNGSPVRCVELVELVTDWMEGELDDGTRAHVEEHVVVCTPCSAYIKQLRQAIEMMRDLDADSAPPAARHALLEAFRTEHQL